MSDRSESKSGPVVSVLVPTFNRPLYLAQAIASVVRQRYRNLQIIVVNDGGRDVTGIVESFNDPRIVFINRRQNRGKPFSLNEAIAHARGRYIAYLDDDDVYYPHHIETLVDALENRTDCGVAYTDLYKVYCNVTPDGDRVVLSKVVEVSRDFDRFLMLYFNHVLHVSCLHRRDLLDRTGPYNEALNVLIDWDMTRRLAFFSDFCHIHQVTGEFYQPVGDSDRISVQRRKSKEEYARNVLTIRTTRPAKPWAKFADLSLIFLADTINQQVGTTIGLIWRYTFYPYKLYLPLPGGDFSRLSTDMPNIVTVPVDPATTQLQRIDRTIAECEGDYVAVVPAGFPVRDMWLEDSLYALLNSARDREAFELEGSTPACWAVVARKEHLCLARSKCPDLPIHEGLMAAGISVRRLRPDEIPFQFDSLLKEAQAEEECGNLKKAAEIYEYIGGHYQNQFWMRSLAAGALFKAGDFARAAELASWINQRRPTVDTLLLEAKLKRRGRDFNAALALLKRAEDILTGEESSDTRTPAVANAYSEI
ncbi:MAG: glycosyltransferase [Sedimentisphaerales bacterium]|nr:glycosyltransferase [Sedimentisphaerales bacterium]